MRGANDTKNDVVALLDSNGAVVVQYKYDAWGNESKTVDNCFWRSETAENLKDFIKQKGFEATACDNVKHAVECAKEAGGLVFVMGSLYMYKELLGEGGEK